jgi:hypothetical protein
LEDLYQDEVGKMSQIEVYRQHWMATLKDRHNCHICCELAVNAEYSESQNGHIFGIQWVCDTHRGVNIDLIRIS